MKRTLVTTFSSIVLAASAAAQCVDTAFPGTQLTSFAAGDDDDGIFSLQPMNLAAPFPIQGAASPAGGFTHCYVGTNGWIFLTNSAGLTTGRPAMTVYGSTAASANGLRGATGNFPLICPYWNDLDTLGGGVWIDNTNPAVCRITWLNVFDFFGLSSKSFSAEIFASGEVRFAYSSGMTNDGDPAHVGVSGRNNASLPSVSDFFPGPATAPARLVYQPFPVDAFDLGGLGITFVPTAPAGTGVGWSQSVTCREAFHETYGSGCYSLATDSVHQFFATPAAAAAALQGNAMVLVPTANGYVASWVTGGASGYVLPSGGALNVFAVPEDDDNAVLSPSIPFTMPGGGTVTSINVMSNGIVTPGAAAVEDNNFAPDAAEFASHSLTAFYSWHDYNESETSTSPAYASGRIKSEEIGGVLYITWDNVENYADPDNTQNPGTMQFQLDLASGIVTILWVAIDTNATETDFPDGLPHLVGVGGPSGEVGSSVVLATALPIVTQPSVSPLMLSASPAPTYSAGNPSTPITFTLDNVVDVAPPFGVGISLLVFSVGSIPNGVDLGPAGIDIGAGGCNLYIPSLDVIIYPTGTAPTATWGPVAIPQPLSPGLVFHSQAFSLFVPNSLPGGLNTAGIVSSNGLQTYFNLF